MAPGGDPTGTEAVLDEALADSNLPTAFAEAEIYDGGDDPLCART